MLAALLLPSLLLTAAPDGGVVVNDGGVVQVVRADPDAGVGEPILPAEKQFPRIYIRGNLVLLQEVYLSIIDLREGATASPETAVEVRDQILSFLHRSGYELAEARAWVEGNTIQVDLDEGQLEKVVLRGKLTWKTIRFKLQMNLPNDVFNRPALFREIQRLSKELALEKIWFELVETKNLVHLGPQMDDLPTIQGLQLVHPPKRYELHIFFAEHEWDTGFGTDIRSGYPDGFEFIAWFQGRNVFIHDDLWRVSASVGGALRRKIGDQSLYPSFSRGFGEVRWYAPKVLAKLTRPFLWIRNEAIARQRPDLTLENYYHLLADVSANLQYEFGEGLTVSFGLGEQYRRVFGLVDTYGNIVPLPPPLTTRSRVRSFALLRTDLVFDAGEDRFDRRHALGAEIRQFIAVNDPNYGEARADYQKVWPFGYHDVWLKAHAALLWGEVIFHDEEPLGRHLRGVFGGIYVHKVASVTGEFRFSITRDLIKLSVFHDLALYERVIRPDDLPAATNETIQVANSFGVGFHALIEGMLQLDFYYSFGFTTGALSPTHPRFDTGASLNLQKVF